MKIPILLILLFPIILPAQSNSMECVNQLVNRQWHAEGTWGNGSVFKQTINFDLSLDGKLITSESLGFVDQEQTVFGHRNDGIRMFDAGLNKIRFWEFDVMGGITTGDLVCRDKDIIYQYAYGGSEVTDMWEHVNDTTYNFTVGEYLDGIWKHKYLETQFTAVPRSLTQIVFESFSNKIAGSWSSSAWAGQLDEEWGMDKYGRISQKATYHEDGKVLFQSTNRIEIVDGSLILTTIVKDGNPKIFKSTSLSIDKVVFENSDYGYPNMVVYHLKNENHFERVISGIEKGVLSEYTFNFHKANQ